MRDASNDLKLHEFLAVSAVDTDALADMHRTIDADDPWKLPCPQALHLNRYVIHEHVRTLTVKRAYDFCDPESGQTLLACREPRIGLVSHLLRNFFPSVARGNVCEFRDRFDEVVMHATFDYSIDMDDEEFKVFNQKRQFLGVVRIEENWGDMLGRLEDLRYLPRASFQGDFREYRFSRANQTIAHVVRQNDIKSFFTYANTFNLEFSAELAPDDPLRILIAAAILRVDIGRDLHRRGKKGVF